MQFTDAVTVAGKPRRTEAAQSVLDEIEANRVAAMNEWRERRRPMLPGVRRMVDHARKALEGGDYEDIRRLARGRLFPSGSALFDAALKRSFRKQSLPPDHIERLLHSYEKDIVWFLENYEAEHRRAEAIRRHEVKLAEAILAVKSDE